MLLTRASIVDLLKHLHPSHFSIRMIYNRYTTCVQGWAMILKAVAKFRHIFLYQEKRKTEFLRNRNFWSPKISTKENDSLSDKSQLDFFSHKIKLVSIHWTPSQKDLNRRCSFQSVLGRVRNHQVKLKTYEVEPRIRNKISRHSTSKIRLYEISGHEVALSV